MFPLTGLYHKAQNGFLLYLIVYRDIQNFLPVTLQRIALMYAFALCIMYVVKEIEKTISFSGEPVPLYH